MPSYDNKLLKRIEKEKNIRKEIVAEGNRSKEPRLKNLSNALDEYYLLNKLQIYCEYLSYTQFTHENHLDYSSNEFKLIKPILDLLEKDNLKNPIIEIYLLIKVLYENCLNDQYDDEETLNTINIKMIEHSKKIDSEDSQTIYSYLTNYCIQKINHNQIKYNQSFLLFANEIINLRYTSKKSQQEFLPPGMFKNMVLAATAIEDDEFFRFLKTTGIEPNNLERGFSSSWEWLEKFIHYYKHKLSPNNYRFYAPYCEAYFEFKRGYFARAFKAIHRPAQEQQMFIRFNHYVLYLQILFELLLLDSDIIENIESTIESTFSSFKSNIHYERTNKNQMKTETHFNFYNTFKKLYRRLLNHYYKYYGLGKNDSLASKNSIKLQKDIDTISFTYKPWLLKKLYSIDNP